MTSIAASPLADYQARFVEEELLPLDLREQRLLEVGAGRGEICHHLPERVPDVAEVVGINIEPHGVIQRPKSRVVSMDACRMTFADASFDVVFSLATFEHIRDLPAALAEMHRVLRPGGLLVSVWSPIWNSFNGHHYGSTLSHVDHRDISLPWAHHVFGRRRLGAYLVRGEGFDPDEAEQAVEFIYGSGWINRLWYRDYRRMLHASPFERAHVDGIRVDFPGLMHRVDERLADGSVSPERVLRFFKRTPTSEILTYKIRAILQRGRG